MARPLHPAMRSILLTASILVFIVGIQLFIFSERTADYFAWTINPPLTAAALGAAYWASFIMELAASRQSTWTRARIGVSAVLLFTTLTLIATYLHRDRFHLGDEFDLSTRFVTWVWIAVYASVPVLMSICLYLQLRTPGQDEPPRLPLPVWVRAILGIHALILLPLGALLFFRPTENLDMWPWLLTPLTARAIAAWLLGLGIAAAHAAWENDWERVAVAVPTYIVLGVFELIALARYEEFFDWDKTSAPIYVLFLVSALVVGVYGWFRTRTLPAHA